MIVDRIYRCFFNTYRILLLNLYEISVISYNLIFKTILSPCLFTFFAAPLIYEPLCKKKYPQLGILCFKGCILPPAPAGDFRNQPNHGGDNGYYEKEIGRTTSRERMQK